MTMFFNIVVLSGLLLAHIATASFDLYAYGQNGDVIISSQQIFFADGL